MTEPLATAPGTVGPGQILFYDSIQPPLTAGAYTFEATQHVLDIPGETVPPYTQSQAIMVDGPRFQIDPATVHAVFPPANQTGGYFDLVPHIVLRDFALPWLRPIQPGSAEQGAGAPPWMGLLTFYSAEMPNGTTPMMTTPTSVDVSEVLIPSDPTVLPPCLPAEANNSGNPVLVTDVDLAFFQAIAPSLAELPFLAHARSVNTDGKVLLGMDDDGCFSLVVGNRVADANGGTNLALLVSLEGHQAHLNGSPTPTACNGITPPNPFTKIRLVVLASWSFTNLPMPGSFLALMEALYAPGNGGVTLFQLPDAAAAAGNDTASEALQIGFVALPNAMRVGEQATSWYHGPLAASPTMRDNSYGPYLFSDHAMYYDPATGIFDQGYAAAWQIGRLLALSDGAFASQLFAWRRGHNRAVQRAAGTSAVQGRLAAALSPDTAEAAALPPVSQLRAFMTEKLGPVAEAMPRVTRRADRARPALPGVIDAQQAAALAEEGTDPLAALRAHLANGGS